MECAGWGGRRGSDWKAVAGTLWPVSGWVWLKALWLQNGSQEAGNGPELWARQAKWDPSLRLGERVPAAWACAGVWNPSCKCSFSVWKGELAASVHSVLKGCLISYKCV